MLTKNNFLKHELIGLKAEIEDSSNTQIIGRRGTIVDETKSMLIICVKKGVKMIPKKETKLKFSINDEFVTVPGSYLVKRSHERLEIKI